MGYGVKAPGPWNSAKNLTWSGEGPPKLQEAFDAWAVKLGITFTHSQADTASFDVRTEQAHCCWDRTHTRLDFKGTETFGTMLHEIGHLLGMSHEHDRPDRREQYYESDSIGFGLLGAKRREELHGLQVYGAYDTESIMQYPESCYKTKSAPSDGDISAVKAINGW